MLKAHYDYLSTLDKEINIQMHIKKYAQAQLEYTWGNKDKYRPLEYTKRCKHWMQEIENADKVISESIERLR